MWLDAVFAYLHFTAIFLLFAFLSVEFYLVRLRLDATTIRQLARVDLWYFGASMATLATGAVRAIWGAKGWEFYGTAWVFWAKVLLFSAVGLLSIGPTRAFLRWRRGLDRDLAFTVPDHERSKVRGSLMIEIHLAAMIPVFAVVMARGLAH